MGRPRSFDDTTVLDAAVDVFRREGFSRASVSRLERATGLSTSSLYHAFGDKDALFERAVDHYVATFVTPRLETFAGPTASLEDLEQLFLSLLAPPLDDGFGCLVINSALELGGDRAVDGVVKGLRAVTDHLDAVLLRETGDTTDATALALLYQGLLVQSRAGLTTHRHRDAVSREFARLRARREDPR